MAVFGDDSLDALKGLHQDLIAVTASRLPNIERLAAELESRVEELKKLLQKPTKNDKSRQTLSSGTIKLGHEDCKINDEFKQDTIQLSDFLDLDELEAANLYNSSITAALNLDRQSLVTSVIVFHERRQYLVECLRLCFRIASVGFDTEEDEAKAILQNIVGRVVQGDGGKAGGGPALWQKVLTTMTDIELWLQQVTDRVQAISMTGQTQLDEFAEIMSFQRTSLLRQHESLAAVSYHLVDAGYVDADCFRSLIGKLKRHDKYDIIMVHYLPVFCTSVTHFASNEGRASSKDAAGFDNSICSTRENDAWILRSLQAAASTFWLAEYSARFSEETTFPEQAAGGGTSADTRSKQFLDALRDGAFQFMLVVAEDVKISPWFDPMRKGLNAFLIQDFPALQIDSHPSEEFFQILLMEQLQNFVEAFITNMPDTLRILRFDEDEQRRQTQGALQARPAEFPLHLERFFIITSYAFERFDQAAEGFWTDLDGNLHGFLVWASQRQPTPRVATFCELLLSISYGSENGDFAHEFLLEGRGVSGKSRRSSPLSWHHLISELEFYSSNVKDRPALQPGNSLDEPALVEPESDMMLECYLRLISHLCRQSPKAREWLLNQPSFHVHEHLLLLCSSSIETRLRANALLALASLLVDKTRYVNEGLWTVLDAWIYGVGNSLPSQQRQNTIQNAPAAAEKAILDSIAIGFEEPSAFVRLLGALIEPCSGEDNADDLLPFPEALGAAYRMPGIDSYVDFVLGRIFALRSRELQDLAQVRILRYQCLKFATNCLSSFNEGLVVFANQSNVSVDAAIRTSSLANYVKTHPFARVVEWFFNDGAVGALFDTVNQNIGEVNEAESSSPLLNGLLQGIEVINLILSMQSTYFDVVRPLIKLQSNSRKPPVANSALASFEDAILNNLILVPQLGLYSGSGHSELAIASLRLMQKLSSSRKLAVPVAVGTGRQSDKSRLITSLERNSDSESIARTLVTQMQFDERSIEAGPESPKHVIQLEILNFLNTCLTTVGDRPTIAHLLLGFTCYSQTLDISPDSLFARGESLFHALVQYTVALPDGAQNTLLSWLIKTRALATAILTRLLQSTLSAQLVLEELRLNDFLVIQWGGQPKIGSRAFWDGFVVETPELLIFETGIAFLPLLRQRSMLLDHAAMELRSISSQGLATLQSRVLSTIMGTATYLDGSQSPCLTLFELIDFQDLSSSDFVPFPESSYIRLQDLDGCRTEDSRFDTDAVEQLLTLRSKELHNSGQITDDAQDQQLQADLNNAKDCILANDRLVDAQITTTALLKSWVQLVTVMLETADSSMLDQHGFILQCLEVILPRLENAYSEDIPAATLYAQLALTLLHQANATPPAPGRTLADETTQDRLLTLFRIAIAGIQDSSASSTLRLTCSHICQDYLRSISKPGQTEQRGLALQSIKARGDSLIEVMCDEAYTGTEENRIAALLLLSALVSTANLEDEKYVVETLARLNFISVLVSNLRHIPADFLSKEQSATAQALTTSTLTLLLLTAQTRPGATHITNANLFGSIRNSGIFSTDPDLGLDYAPPNTSILARNPTRNHLDASPMAHYHNLLTHLTRLVLAVTVSKGAENEGMMREARGFCSEYRGLICAVFKRSAGVGLMGRESVREGNEKGEGRLRELAETLMVLVSVCGWVESEEGESRGARKGRTGLFS